MPGTRSVFSRAAAAAAVPSDPRHPAQFLIHHQQQYDANTQGYTRASRSYTYVQTKYEASFFPFFHSLRNVPVSPCVGRAAVFVT